MQEIIVYRSPLEAAMWHSAVSAEMIPIFAGIIVFFVAFVCLDAAAKRLWGWRYRSSNWMSYGLLFDAAVIGGIVAAWLWV